MTRVLVICGLGAAAVIGVGMVNFWLGFLLMFPVCKLCDWLLSRS